MSTHARTATAVFLVAALGACGGSNSSPTSPSTSPGAAASPAPPVSADNASAHYVSAAQGGQPAFDIVLFFNASSNAASAMTLRASAISPQPFTATAYNVTGSYSTGPGGFSGSVTGTLSGTPTSGSFTGVVTANLTNGCVASENYSGALTASTLNWTPAGAVNNCGGTSPLTSSISTAAVNPLPVTATSGTYTGSFSVPVVVSGGAGNPCSRVDTNAGTLTLSLTIAADGTVTGSGHAIGTETSGPTIGPASCGGSTSSATNHYETVPGDQIAGSTTNFGFTDSQTVAITGGTAVFKARFFGAFSGNTITGVFTNSEDISNTSAAGCNGKGGDCTGTGSATIVLTKQ